MMMYKENIGVDVRIILKGSSINGIVNSIYVEQDPK
jgi:hypothetical protein